MIKSLFASLIIFSAVSCKKFDINDLSDYPDLAPYIKSAYYGYHNLTDLVKPVTDVVKTIPYRAERTVPRDPLTGEALYKTVPEDLERRVDMAMMDIQDRRYKAGR